MWPFKEIGTKIAVLRLLSILHWQTQCMSKTLFQSKTQLQTLALMDAEMKCVLSSISILKKKKTWVFFTFDRHSWNQPISVSLTKLAMPMRQIRLLNLVAFESFLSGSFIIVRHCFIHVNFIFWNIRDNNKRTVFIEQWMFPVGHARLKGRAPGERLPIITYAKASSRISFTGTMPEIRFS